MHVIFVLLAVGVVGFLVYRFYFAPARPSQVAGPRSDTALAFISNGMLFFRERGGKVQQLHSPYAQEAQDRRERVRERHSWKEGTSFAISAGGRMRDTQGVDKPLVATSAVYQRDGSLFYFLKDENIGGLFRRDAASGNEERVLLRQGLQLGDLMLSPEGSQLAASSQRQGGIANIALVGTDGNSLREVTGGDTVDTAPCWIPGVANRMLFQSCGLARDAQGYIVAQGPASVQKLDMESGSVTPILDDAGFDHLKPRVDAAGNLLFIRRPYEAPRYEAHSFLTDILLFPFRLLRAVFHYLNFFSLMYSRKPLTSASGPAFQADLKNILLQGRRIDAEKALRSARTVQGVPSLVPDSWVLVRRDAGGQERVLATNVASYDLAGDGSILFSNGGGVFVLESDGSARLAVTDELVLDVVAPA